MKKEIMTPYHKDWDGFCGLLDGEEGCNFREDENGKIVWTCDNSSEKPLSRKILKKYFPDVDVEETIKYFEGHGGYCDCEVLFNVK
jgi:hypothetical protein